MNGELPVLGIKKTIEIPWQQASNLSVLC